VPETFDKHGIRFRFPDAWELTEETAENTISITVAPSAGLFWSVTLFFDGPSPDDVVETAVQAFGDEYPEHDVYNVPATLGPHRGIGADIEFVALDLVNSAFLRACRTERFTALVLYQGTDRDLEESLEVLEAISESLELDGGSGEWPDFAAREEDEEDDEWEPEEADEEEA
jgi:hypothetical protein